MTRDELIEAAARALCEHAGGDPDVVLYAGVPGQSETLGWSTFRKPASAVVEAIEPLIRADEKARENEACALMMEEESNKAKEDYKRFDGQFTSHRIRMFDFKGAADAIRARMKGEG